MPEPDLLVTKFTLPPLRSVLLHRSHLLEVLEQSRSLPLTLLSAGAGFGKTTLLSAWASRNTDQVAWLSLDEQDNDPIRFWTYVIAALRHSGPRLSAVGEGAEALLRSQQPPLLTSALISLINELAALAQDTTLILDDYHVIREQAIHDSLQFVLDHLPTCLHLGLSSRVDPPLPLARLRLPTPESYTTGSFTSKDGTTIGYRQLGQGPAVVLLHGGASSGYYHIQLAELLADTFTVYLPDRRGRGLSGPYGEDYRIQKDVEDMDALLTKTGAHLVFGVSGGALIWLQAALTLATIHKAVILEPPLLVNDSLPLAYLARYEREVREGKLAAALITGMKAAQMGPRIMNAMPRWLLELITNMAMKSEEKKGSGGSVPMRELATMLHYDFQLVVEMSGKLESFRTIGAEVLLLGGSRSPAYLKVVLDALEKVLPRVTCIELPGLDHAASWNTDRGGQPGPVAQALRCFFAEP